MMATSNLLSAFPTEAPAAPKKALQYADIAVTATAKEFTGIYRGKNYHEPDFQDVLDRASKAGVQKILLTGMSLSDIDTNLSLTASRLCSLTIGVHPYHAAEPESDSTYFDKLFARVDELYLRDRAGLDTTNTTRVKRILAGYGELGLDYDHLEWASKEVQLRTFRTQLDMFVSKGYELPLFLHCRNAFSDFVAVMSEYLPRLSRRGIVHSFVGTADAMGQLTDMGFDVSVNGFSFKDEQSLEMVSAVPMERLQIETDAPWGFVQSGSEVSKRYCAHVRSWDAKKKDKFVKGIMVKERNESCLIDRVAYVVAGLKGISVEEVAERCSENSLRMFWPEELAAG